MSKNNCCAITRFNREAALKDVNCFCQEVETVAISTLANGLSSNTINQTIKDLIDLTTTNKKYITFMSGTFTLNMNLCCKSTRVSVLGVTINTTNYSNATVGVTTNTQVQTELDKLIEFCNTMRSYLESIKCTCCKKKY